MPPWRSTTATLLVLAATAASAAEIEVTPFIGARFGGEFEEFQTGPFERLELEDGSSFGLTLGLKVGPHADIEVLYSRQSTRLRSGQFLGPSVDLTDINVDQFHLGGLYVFREQSSELRPFVSFSAGGTRFSPEDDLASETKLSLALGGGIKFALSRHLGVRLQVRVVPTLIEAEDEVYCWYGCDSVTDSNWVTQAELSAGLVLKF